jgi:hypothetical protein
VKILVTNVWLSERGGSELFTKWLTISLHRAGHEVTCFTPVCGIVSEEIAHAGVCVVSDLEALRGRYFDLIHAHHRTPSALVKQMFPQVPMLYLAHGTEPEEEQPPKEVLGRVRYLAISEGVKHNLNERHAILDVDIVRNPIDVDEFRSFSEIRSEPRSAILLKNAIDPGDFSIMESFFKDRGIAFDLVGGPKSRPDVVNAINEADLVISWGRGVLEALACERAVIAYGHDHLVDGMITSDNFYGFRTRSFNGRVGRQPLSRETLARELEKYVPSRTFALRRIVSWDHASKNVLDTLLKHYNTLVGSTMR